jgi:hypothetical protein
VWEAFWPQLLNAPSIFLLNVVHPEASYQTALLVFLTSALVILDNQSIEVASRTLLDTGDQIAPCTLSE